MFGRPLKVFVTTISMFGLFGVVTFGSPTVWALATRKTIKKKEAQKAAEKARIPPEDQKPQARPSLLPTSIPEFRLQPAATAYQPLCGHLFVTSKDDLSLNTMERRLVCGDESGGVIGRPWADVPPNEMAYFLKGFLQTRGYHHPEFTQDEDRLYVKLGPISRLKNLKLLGGPEGWQPPMRRLVIGEPLTPALLNETQSWALGQIKDEGYACADDSIQADPDSGEAAVFFHPHDRKRIRFLEQIGDHGVNEGALNRYNAFVMGDFYKDRMVALTRRRTLEDGFLQTLVMTTKCGPGDEVTIVRDVSLGPPRTVRIGVGGSTDLGVLTKAVLRQARIGSSASSAQATLNVSYLEQQVNNQSLKGNFKWYYLKGENRYSLDPQIEFKHEATYKYDLRSTTIDVLHGWTFDTTGGHYDLRAGPGFISEDQERSTADHVIKAGYVETGGRWTDHDFEWFNTSPRTGEYLDVTGLFALQKMGSNFTAQKVQVTGEKLWTIGAFDPPLFVLGTRFNFSTVFSPNNDPTVLPARFLTRLGGDNTLRGYTVDSLPRSGVGALTGANASLEGRFHDVFFKIIDVFAFWDAGILGGANAQLTTPIFMSPGFGLRWESPFGVLRGYVARRFAVEEKPDEEPYDKALRFGLTFGQEF